MIDVSNELAIGIDIGGTNTKYGLVNHRGDILERGDLKTDAHPTIEGFIDALYEATSPLIKKTRGRRPCKRYWRWCAQR